MAKKTSKTTGTKSKARKRLGIDPDHRVLLCLDGGGIRGIMTLQLLKKLEQVAGMACFELFDMVAGSSTGGIIAGLIARGKKATEIEELYEKLVRKVFKQRSFLAHRFTNPPLYSKVNYRNALRSIVGSKTTLQQACQHSGIDLMITAKDVVAGEETFFTCFRDGPRWKGAYRQVLLRAAMEATMSAPTYFTPLERFIDGGTTTYNNPTLAAIIEAVRYGPRRAYAIDKLTVFSFGTGCRPQFVGPKEVLNPPGLDVKFWLHWLMTESGDDASDLQSYLLRTKALFPGLDFRRFQVSLDRQAIRKLPNQPLGDIAETDADWLHDLGDEELAEMQLDKVGYFPVMKAIGRAVVEYIVQEAAGRGEKPFGFDLVNARRKALLVSRRGDVRRIQEQMASAQWLDEFAK